MDILYKLIKIAGRLHRSISVQLDEVRMRDWSDVRPSIGVPGNTPSEWLLNAEVKKRRVHG